MLRVTCVDDCVKTTCLLSGRDNFVRMRVEDLAKLRLAPGTFTYLEIQDGDRSEVVLYKGEVGTESITVERSSGLAFPPGSVICQSFGCKYLEALIADRIAQAFSLEAPDIRDDENVWTGTNSFTKTTYFGAAELSSAEVITSDRLRWNKGHYVSFTSSLPDSIHGYLAVVRKTGVATLPFWGAKFVAEVDAGAAASIAIGVESAADGALTGAELIGARSAVNVAESTAPAKKSGHIARFRNRAEGQAAAQNGFGGNRYNENSSAYTVSSQSRSAAGEFCGWNKGLYFPAGSLDRAISGGAIGVDFSDIPTSEVPRLEAAMALVADMPVSWNANSISAPDVKTKYNPNLGTFEFISGNATRLRVKMDNGMLQFNDAGASSPLLSPTSTGPAGFMFVEINGSLLKVQVFNP